MKPRVIIVRESAETLTCSNCAGTLEGIDAFGSREVPDYHSIRSVMDRAGKLFVALRKEFGHEVDIDVVDPRNGLYLIPTLLADFRRYRPGLRRFMRTLLLGISPASIIINGNALHVGEFPATELVVDEVRSALEKDSERNPSPRYPVCDPTGSR